MCFEDLGNFEKLVGFIILTWFSCTSHSLPCIVSLPEPCPASLYYVPRTMKSLEETAVCSIIWSKHPFLIQFQCQGSYGSVYLGKLKGTDVAIKQLKNTKSKEFISEINILCKVLPSNLIELIGYAAGGHSLFLVYEFAQNGALSDHLHGSTAKEICDSFKRPTIVLSIVRDAAKGLECIHKHTKPYYVHQDVKTSNILLDSNFRANIADFGLVKLLEHSPEVGAAASRIVGTFGYLARRTTENDTYIEHIDS
ncbi:hypothetical protein DITRI_Ditri10aG0128900 [Diplodiscus trichospermus]